LERPFRWAVLGSLGLVLLAVTFAAGALAYRHVYRLSFPPQNHAMLKVEETLEAISHVYVEKISEDRLAEGAVKGIMSELDPYSRYLPKKEYKEFTEEAGGHFDGVGLMVGMKEKNLAVVSTIKGTPAERAGLKPGDFILKIDNRSTKSMALDVAVNLIRGKAGTTVALTVQRNGVKDPFVHKLVRARITIPNTSSEMLDGKIAWVWLHFFNQEATKELDREAKELVGKGARGIILDLRDNPGGLLDQAVGVTGMFVDQGLVVSTKNRTGVSREYSVPGGAAYKDFPLVVLVNGGSASASEIVAGAIQDHKRGTVVGEKTFGKASVQDVLPLSDGSALTITTAKYLTPKGRSIAQKGIKPDIVVKGNGRAPADDAQLKRAKQVLLDLLERKAAKANQEEG